jgi:aldehyde:ferredoxin oxidoreductase
MESGNDGYAGKLLFVNLSDGSIKKRILTAEMKRNYIGGGSLGARILYDMIKPGSDSLGPDNVVGFVTGPVTGSNVFFGSRYTLVCKSPLSGTYSDANAGGYFGTELKRAGYDGVFIRGAAEEPVYLWVNDDEVEIRSAKALWGKDCKETPALLHRETGEPKLRASVIGPAGEKLSLISCPINDGHRAPARGGSGAVMGSKKFKGIAVRGTGRIPVADPARIKAINRMIKTAMKNSPRADVVAGWSEYGTGYGTGDSFLAGRVPVKNWRGVGGVDFSYAKEAKISATTLNKHKVKSYGCYGCPLRCGAIYQVQEGRWPLSETNRPEYETLAAFGLNLANESGEAILKCNDIVNRAGLDSVSTGATVAWVMECYEKGILTKQELDGIEATWGNPEAIVALTDKIARAKGCGKVLALGSARAAKKWYKGSECLMVVKDVELPMHDSRFAPGMARTYAYDPTPARHVKGGLGSLHMFDTSQEKYRPVDKGQEDLVETCTLEMNNASGLCLIWGLSGVPNDTHLNIIAAVTGWHVEPQEQMHFGMRSMAVKQAFNVREGFKPKDFVIPPRAIGDPPLKEGPLAGISVDIEFLRKNFFNAIGWDLETGKPARASLIKLGLADVARDLYG